jgi:hypothetical protein
VKKSKHLGYKWIEPKNILTPKDAIKKKLPEEFPVTQNDCDLTSLETHEAESIQY